MVLQKMGAIGPLSILVLLAGGASGASVTWTNTYWLREGGSEIFQMNGEGFSVDQFNQFDPVLGNKVYFVNEADTIACPVKVSPPEFSGHPSKSIFCETKSRKLTPSLNRKYKVVVFVDGVEATCDKTIEFSSWDTPKIRSITPRWHLPGTLVKYYGWLRASKFWVFDTQDAIETGSGQVSKTSTFIKEVFLGNVDCDFYDKENEEYYGEITSNYLWCLPKTKYIGPMNGTFRVTSKGAAIHDKYELWVDSQDKMYLTHTYAGLSSVSPQESGSAGGAEITLTGKYFDPQPGQTKVTIGGAECVIKDIADETLTCIAPPSSETGPAPGERGWLYETWEGIGDAWNDANFWGEDLDEPFSTYTTSHPNYNATVVDSLLFNIPFSGGVIARLSGYLHIPHDGRYAFAIGTGTGSSQNMRISTNGNPLNKTSIGHWVVFNAEASTPVFVEVVVKSAELSEFHGYMNDFDGKYNSYQNAMSQDERLDIVLAPQHKEEVQRVEIQGTPASSYSLFINGRTSNAIDITDTEKVREEILSMASYTCEIVGDNPKIYYLTDYEDDSANWPKTTSGSARTHVEPYCGRKSLEPTWHYPRLLDTQNTVEMVDMTKYKFACFAYKGVFEGSIQVNVKWFDIWNRDRHDSFHFENALDDSQSDKWSFKCLDLHTKFEETWMADYDKEGTYRRVRFFRLPYSKHRIESRTYVDYFFFSTEDVSVTRIPSAFDANGILLDDVVITPVNDSIYDIELVRSNCGADFPLLGIASAEANAVSLSSAQEFTFNLDGDVKVVTSRQEIATHDATGTWDMVFLGENINDISRDIEGYELANFIKNAIGNDGIRVEKYGSCQKQYWRTYLDTIPGRQNIPIVKSDNIVFEGESIVFEGRRGREGKTWHDNIQGDFLSVRREDPHVAVTVNGYRAVCQSDCSFSYTDSGIPAVTSLSSTSGDLKIQGTDFSSSDIEDYTVMVGDNECTVTAVTTTKVTCSLPTLASGSYPVTVSMQPIGYASQPSPALSYTMSLSVTSVEPSTGGTGGGYEVEITGTGFPETLEGWNGNSVLFGGEDCPITAATVGIVTCMVPSGSSGAVDVVADVNGESDTLSNGFTYDAALSASVDSVSPTEAATVLGGETLTIAGSNFGSQTSGKVLVGEEECLVETWSSSSITCTLPSNVPGSHTVTVITSLGKASGSSSVQYTLKVTSSSEAQGSINGGVLMVFNGEGFGTNCSQYLKIDLGDTAECEIMECSDTQISCTTRTLSKNHVITNLGTLQSYGVGYAWSSKSISISVGDTVTWKWEKSSVVSQLLYNVYQMSSPLDKEYDGKGFNSGAQSDKGSYTVKFPSTGKFYYGGDIIYKDIQMTGTVVVRDHCPGALKVTVLLGDIAASYEPDDTSVDITVPGCASILTTEINEGCDNKTRSFFGTRTLSELVPVLNSHCSLKQGTPSDDSLYFMSDLCKTPTVTDIAASATETVAGISGIIVIADTTFTISGEGFGTELCQTSVSVGDSVCTVTATADDEITCTLDSQESLTSIKAAPVSVTVINRGLASLNLGNYDESLITVVPVITSFSPSEGSTAGGTQITITGAGLRAFDNVARVSMGGTLCEVKTVTSTSIICSTGPAAAGPVVISVLVSTYNIPAVNELTDSTFTYSDALTPSVTDVSYSEQSATITGASFGTDSSKVTVIFTPTSSRRKRSLDDEFIVKEENMFDQNKKVHNNRERDIDAEEANARTFEYEEDEHPRDTYKPVIDSTRFDNMEDTTDFWGIFTNSSARTLDESIDKGAWRRAGSNAKVAPKEEELENNLNTSKRSAETTSYECSPTTMSETEIICDTTDMPGGSYDISVNIEGLGDAAIESGSVSADAVASSIDASSGSINGGALVTISGSGFNPGAISVTIDGSECSLVSEAADTITCITPSHAVGVAPVVVTTDGNAALGSITYTYDDLKTPDITSVSPSSSVSSGDSLTISGTKLALSGNDPDVLIDEESCTITASSDTSITCTLPDKAGGTYSVVVRDATYGDSNSDITVIYSLDVDSVSPNEAGFGGVEATISGAGFEPSGSSGVTVCGEACIVISASSSSITCTVPPKTQGASSTEACDVVVTNNNGDSSTLSSGFTYDSSLTAVVSSISPTRGGTAGGTTLTITGTGFVSSGNSVTIDDIECIISSETTTSITCVTEAHSGPGSFPVTVTIPGKGIADTSAADEFFYIDRWSSIFTWGGENPPLEGEFVVIETGQTILIDESTPVLKMLLIKGGHVVFDPDASSEIILRSEYILIIDGGSLNIGSEEEPYQGEAIIEMHGNVLSTELPVYGAKVIGVRNGTLDLHGAYIPVTWTHLASTASAGDDSITLKQPVTWKAGDQIVIATTEKKFTKNENEQFSIESVSADGYTITLNDTLKYEHISIEQTFAGRTIETRAEVGLLTRNVKIRGDVNPNFVKDIPACGDEWKPGQFDVQTCFNGRHGEETGTAEFGAIVLFSGKYPNQNLVQGRFSYMEVTEAGQAFHLGRYPIHFHLVGNVNTSYVRGCSLHRTYNRAITMHAADYLTVERNVIYNNKGHAIFTEDGVEQFNVIQYNLAIYTRSSSSLLNVDITPAAYWVVNPNNVVQHNAAAGGHAFGYWYRAEGNPSGPSFTEDYCPMNEQMGRFFNNTAHSFGRYGLWIFSMNGIFPTDGVCGSGNAVVAKWEHFTVWNCERGAEVVFGGALQFHNFVALDNEMAGLEMVDVSGSFGENDGAGVFDSLLIGHSALSPVEGCGDGIVAPKKKVFNIANCTFINFDRTNIIEERRRKKREAAPIEKCAAMSGCSQCKFNNVAYEVQVRDLKFENADQKLRFKWHHEQVWIDADGSLSGGAPESVVLPNSNILPSQCTKDVAEFSVNAETPGSVCSPPIKFHRWAMDGTTARPTSLQGRSLNISNANGMDEIIYHHKRQNKKEGWAAYLFSGDTYKMAYDYSEAIQNISYDAHTYHLEDEDYFYIEHDFIQIPDGFGTVNNSPRNSSDSIPDPVDSVLGDFYWDEDNKKMTYIVKKDRSRKGRDVTFEDRDKGSDRSINFDVWRCQYEDCMPPTAPPPVVATTYRWSDSETWKNVPVGSGGHPDENTYGLPVKHDSIVIPEGMRLLVDTDTPKLRIIQVYGILEFEDTMDHVFDATIIYVRGDIENNGQVVAGSEDSPFTNKLKIILRGDLDPNNQDNTPMPPIVEISVGWKAMGVFGLLSLHGEDVGKTWVKLGASVNAGKKIVTLAEPVTATWLNKEVMITATGKDSEETEVRTVTDVSSDGLTLTLDSDLAFDHLGETHSLSDGTTYTMAGEVGLLSRNVVIEGGDYNDILKDNFGGRVLVSKMNVGEAEYIGVAELTNVEFRNMGQEGFIDEDDPRYALALHTLGTSTSFIKKCSFNHNFNTAVGLFGTDTVLVEDNVVYHTVSSSFRDDSSGTVFRHNLVSTMLYPGAYQDREEGINFHWYAGFYLNFASGTVMEDNVVAGSDQAGYATYGALCEETTTWYNNEVHGAAYGVMLWKKSSGPVEECRRIDNVYAWRIWDTAFYFQTYASVILEQAKVADSQLGVNLLIHSPHALTHEYYDKTATIKDSLFIGASPSHTCDYNDYVPSLKALGLFSISQLWKGNGGNTAMFIGSFLASKNGAPSHPFWNSMSYPAIRGSTHVDNVKFAHYNTRSCGKDVAISTNPGSEDAQHPTFTNGLTFLDSTENNYIFLHKPKLGSINPSDCVDMTCDALKKIIITDSDGSLLGTAGATATAISEYEWDGDDRHGVGDYRVPISLKTAPDGSQITAEEKFPNKGIVRNDDCILNNEMRIWKCTGIKHRMMIIESMDVDTEIRRLSPIALIANPGTNGYVDLLNGPMDHGWCFGYTCQERISTFYSVVASDTIYEMGLTSTPPQVLRFHLLNADPSEAVVIRMFFPKTQRYDIYVDGIYVLPTNIDTSKDSYQLLPEDDSFFPTLTDAVGSNYLQRSLKLLHVVVKGGHYVDIKTTPAIVVSTGLVIDEGNFFEENVVENLALLLGVPLENIRVVNVIREDSKRRRRGATEFVTVETEIASAPSSSLNESESSSGNFTGAALSFADLETAAAKMATAFQTGAADAFGNYTLAAVEIADPMPPPPKEAPAKATEESGSVVIEGGELFTVTQQKEEEEKLKQTETKSYPKPGSLAVNATVGGSPIAFITISEGPIIAVVDTEGKQMDTLGHPSDPWRLTATLVGGPAGAELVGDVEAPFVNGMANFENIAVSKPGSDYTIMFELTYPENATALITAMGATFSVADKSLSLVLPSLEGPLTAYEHFNFGPLIIWDDDLNAPIDPAALSDQTMVGQLSVVKGKGTPKFKGSNSRFSVSGEEIANFTAKKLRLNNKPGVDIRFEVECSIKPAGWKLSEKQQKGDGVVLLPRRVVMPDDPISKNFSMVAVRGNPKKLKGKEEEFELAVQTYLLKRVGKAYYSDVELTLGKKQARVTITVVGSNQQLLNAQFAICKLMKKFVLKVKLKGVGMYKFQYLYVDGKYRKECNRGRLLMQTNQIAMDIQNH